MEIDWIELNGRGTVAALTTGRASLPGMEVRGDFGFALIRMEGADNLCFGRLGGATGDVRAGSAVRLVRADGQWAHPAQCAVYVPDAP